MGAYCEILLDDHAVWSEKNFDPPGLEIVFREEDRFDRLLTPTEAEDVGFERDLGYRVPLAVARFRLALCGYSVAATRAKYGAWRKEKQRPGDEFHSPAELSDTFYSRLSYDDYAELLRRIVLESAWRRELDEDEEYVLYGPTGYRYAFPSQDPNDALAAILHSIEGEVVSVSMADLVSGDLWDPSYELERRSPDLIVMTEGRTDNEILRGFIELFYPDHARTMRFFDYGYRPQGGASNNVNLLKSLAAAGIGEPILAIFDNDTAGHQQLERARALTLPSNVMLASYPDLDLLRNYPTLGPSGTVMLDVNGSAGCIEMYLGADCLTQDGRLAPVRWTGYIESMGRYQGAIANKAQVVEAFRAKLRRCGRNRSPVVEAEWDALRQIMATIESAVRDRPA